jgi:hypothetical protein
MEKTWLLRERVGGTVAGEGQNPALAWLNRTCQKGRMAAGYGVGGGVCPPSLWGIPRRTVGQQYARARKIAHGGVSPQSGKPEAK